MNFWSRAQNFERFDCFQVWYKVFRNNREIVEDVHRLGRSWTSKIRKKIMIKNHHANVRIRIPRHLTVTGLLDRIYRANSETTTLERIMAGFERQQAHSK